MPQNKELLATIQKAGAAVFDADAQLKLAVRNYGERVHAAPTGQIVTQPVEKRFAHPHRRWSQTRTVKHRQRGALPAATNDADFLGC